MGERKCLIGELEMTYEDGELRMMIPEMVTSSKSPTAIALLANFLDRTARQMLKDQQAPDLPASPYRPTPAELIELRDRTEPVCQWCLNTGALVNSGNRCVCLRLKAGPLDPPKEGPVPEPISWARLRRARAPGRFCVVCGGEQRHCRSGWVCEQGHGGADWEPGPPETETKPASVVLSLDDPCPHPARHGLHEIYTGPNGEVAHCRACGATRP